MTVIYNPCACCGGKGFVPHYPSQNSTSVTNTPLYNEMCYACNGTGKGTIKEIREP